MKGYYQTFKQKLPIQNLKSVEEELSVHERIQILLESPGQAFIPEPKTHKGLEEGIKKNRIGTKVIYKKGIRRVTLQRVILSRIRWSPEKVTADEIIVIFDNLLYLQDLALREEQFREKFGKTLEVLSKDFKELDLLNKANIVRFVENLYKLLHKDEYKDFIIPLRNLRRTESHFVGVFKLLPTEPNGIPRNLIPPKPYIGIGYRDKGSRRDQAKDGSPSWQEVARSKRLWTKNGYYYYE